MDMSRRDLLGLLGRRKAAARGLGALARPIVEVMELLKGHTAEQAGLDLTPRKSPPPFLAKHDQSTLAPDPSQTQHRALIPTESQSQSQAGTQSLEGRAG